MALDTAGNQPDWLHLLPAGEARTIDGRGPYRLTDPAAIIRTSMANGKLVLDENHSTDLAAPEGRSSPARGWIVELQSRSDGIWGRVEWTPEGRSLRAAYRGISPAIMHKPTGDVIAILRASLTNTPNITGLTTLHSQEHHMDYRATLGTVLGLEGDFADKDLIVALDDFMRTYGDKIKQDSKRKTATAPVALNSLARNATIYQRKMADAGISIDYATAVRAVHDGTAIL